MHFSLATCLPILKDFLLSKNKILLNCFVPDTVNHQEKRLMENEKEKKKSEHRDSVDYARRKVLRFLSRDD